jgi:predicted kinase
MSENKLSLVVIVTGLPGTGKTNLGMRIAREFSIPFINKDGIKERLFDSLGWEDRPWSKKLSLASVNLLYYFLEAQLAAGGSIVVESNFDSHLENPQFRQLKEKYSFEIFQILCVTQGEVLFERFRLRGQSGKRHPGHVDQATYEELSSILLKGRAEPLDIGGVLVEVDTTDYGGIDYDGLFSTIREALIKDSNFGGIV